MKRGFTLVELSIVLVIIGLLIGGILVAQSMLSTSRITGTIQQLGQFDAGTENFKTKYNYLPGDAPAFGGNGDRVVGHSDAQSRGFFCEMSNYWFDIMPDQYYATSGGNCPGANPGHPPTISGTSKNAPAAKIGKVNSFFIATGLSTDGGYSADTSSPTNYYAILDPIQGQTLSGFYYYTTSNASNSAVTPVELLALDTKSDDGIANAGNILSGSLANQGGSGKGGIISGPAAGICSSGATYTLTGTHASTYECIPLIRIGAQAGDPQ